MKKLMFGLLAGAVSLYAAEHFSASIASALPFSLPSFGSPNRAFGAVYDAQVKQLADFSHLFKSWKEHDQCVADLGEYNRFAQDAHVNYPLPVICADARWEHHAQREQRSPKSAAQTEDPSSGKASSRNSRGSAGFDDGGLGCQCADPQEQPGRRSDNQNSRSVQKANYGADTYGSEFTLGYGCSEDSYCFGE